MYIYTIYIYIYIYFCIYIYINTYILYIYVIFKLGALDVTAKIQNIYSDDKSIISFLRSLF